MKKLFFVLCFFVFGCVSFSFAQTNQDQQILQNQEKPPQPVTLNYITLRSVSTTQLKIQPVLPVPRLIEMKGILKSQPLIVPATDSNNTSTNVYPVIYKASLYDMDGKLIAILQSTSIPFAKYDGKFVYVSGYLIITTVSNPQPVPTITVMPLVPTIEVKEIKIIYNWIEQKGILRAQNSVDSAGQPYKALLYDDAGRIVAYLQSTVIPLAQYDNTIVNVAGFEIPVPILQRNSIDDGTQTVIPLIPLIDVQRIKVIAKWIEMEGLCKADNSSSQISPPYTAKLYGENATLSALLYSYEIPLFKYSGMTVHIGGFAYPSISAVATDSDSSLAMQIKAIAQTDTGQTAINIIPVVDVRKIAVIYVPPPVEVWKGIAYPNDNLNPYAIYAPYTLKNPDGSVIGLLTTNSKYISALLLKYKINFVIAVAGPVKKLENSTLPVEIKIMDVEKLKVIEDLRHIIWMKEEPLVFRVGEKINFNKIGDIKWRGFAVNPSDISSLTADDGAETISEDLCAIQIDNEGACLPVLQKYWDFDTKIAPLLEPLPEPNPLPADNEGIIIDQPIPLPIPMPPYNVPVDYFSYDYIYDSRILSIVPHEPVFAYKAPGIYRITLTGAYADRNGFVSKIETATRIIRVIPALSADMDDIDNDGAL